MTTLSIAPKKDQPHAEIEPQHQHDHGGQASVNTHSIGTKLQINGKTHRKKRDQLKAVTAAPGSWLRNFSRLVGAENVYMAAMRRLKAMTVPAVRSQISIPRKLFAGKSVGQSAHHELHFRIQKAPAPAQSREQESPHKIRNGSGGKDNFLFLPAR